VKRNMQNRRLDILSETARELIGETLERVIYFDGVTDAGVPYYHDLLEPTPGRHELMQGIDLVTGSGQAFSFYWKAFRDFELAVIQGSMRQRLPNFDAVFDVSHETPWNDRISHAISDVVFSAAASDEFGYICDCRLEFTGADPIWICARQDTLDCMEHGDATIVVFDRDEAIRIGVRVDAE